MDIVLLIKAVIMGVVEGLTEFLPISSTGHLILAGALLDFNDAKAKLFDIVIQCGAILAVVWEYRRRIGSVVVGLRSDPKSQRFVVNVFIGFLPLAILGLLFQKQIKEVLFAPVPVAIAFIVGGLIILLIEWRHREGHFKPRIAEVDDLRWKDALKLGFAQALALIPGTSRSGSTIIGGLYMGLSRKAATEFSFFLAIPTLFSASAYELYKNRALLSVDDIPMFVVGLIAAFVSAFLCVRWLLRYVSQHDFTIFAWYRIAFGVLVLATDYSGLVNWYPQ
ncbi:MAG: undecaprenyl-diphosphate phosphatase [Spongiibacteraceae bacterium]